ncbi:hypothetical protein Mal15_23410 [Stieleria maiorica]|uniref:Uncharacterized protein n=1 Tax=Stieleria maiorica TaxID=2795974 RepID=A0A5B9ME87_9BACT|nr:hypothetical protein [Stieleria maiorica]QEF98290.1 hypothetical protein Mal15_23410 [Stieleria maiorica]
MIRLFPILLLAFPVSLWAEETVVRIECILFDGPLPTDAQQELTEQLNSLPRDERNEQRAMLTLRAHRKHLQTLATTSLDFHASPGQTASQRIESNDLLFEAKVKLIESDEVGCTLTYSVGAAYVEGHRSHVSQSIRQPDRMRYGASLIPSSSGTDDLTVVFLTTVSKGAEITIKIEKEFGQQFIRDRRRPPNARVANLQP